SSRDTQRGSGSWRGRAVTSPMGSGGPRSLDRHHLGALLGHEIRMLRLHVSGHVGEGPLAAGAGAGGRALLVLGELGLGGCRAALLGFDLILQAGLLLLGALCPAA